MRFYNRNNTCYCDIEDYALLDMDRDYRRILKPIAYINCMNYIDRDDRIISDVWFKDASVFEDGFGHVLTKNNEYFLINTNGDLIYNKSKIYDK